ncbi:MAG: glucose-6-phosphate dehydrogenase, partial [Dehalococcoidia bacterium]
MMPQAIANPLREGLRQEWMPQPFTMVIFGVSGDLSRRMLLPALYNLALDRRLPSGFSVIGFARREWDDEAFRQEALAAVNIHSRRRPVDPAVWDSFAQGLFFCPGDFSVPEDYRRLQELVARVDRERCTCGNRIFYLATQPSAYTTVIDHLGGVGLASQSEEPGNEGSGWARVIVEKPFGRDLASAQALNAQVHRVFPEGEVYRIDHYLGKETVQNILVFRFANGIFEPIWNRRFIDHVQITAAEGIGVEQRSGYYEEAGALRDMVQNHLLQLTS